MIRKHEAEQRGTTAENEIALLETLILCCSDRELDKNFLEESSKIIASVVSYGYIICLSYTRRCFNLKLKMSESDKCPEN
jgi:hypothetical protein